ncbi:MAG: hypothetical protein KGD63_12785 [Candidatus Lokiarchaeota archaeon]|nr:hypothetical protein [Candidatus Lokiarchaeota archaeon]
MARLIIGVLGGVLLSFISVSIFQAWVPIETAQLIIETNGNFFQATSEMVGANFKFDIIGFFLSWPNYSIQTFFSPAFFGCALIGFIAGILSIGVKRGIMASVLVIIITFLMWILFSIFSGEDLMSLFQGIQLRATIGGVLGALLSGISGGIIGGFLTGKYPNIKRPE